MTPTELKMEMKMDCQKEKNTATLMVMNLRSGRYGDSSIWRKRVSEIQCDKNKRGIANSISGKGQNSFPSP
jgi:hypothetical protein